MNYALNSYVISEVYNKSAQSNPSFDDIVNLTNSVLDIIDAKERWLQEHNYIDVKYTDDEYGRAAEELGLIAHAYDDDAGIDLPIVLSANERDNGIVLAPHERRLLHTGICTAFPEGYWGLIIHRSSTEYKQQLRVVEGIIDNYRDELLIHVHNIHNTESKPIIHGQKLGQLILMKTAGFRARIVSTLRPSERGTNGFGSSGI